ncbi:uncharacterized protein LOC105646115 isoform X2 [Jatropha curcas]|nr:uncharacterized protein LOC105646115 isoform X2 [Jatropha curcas]
MRMKVTLSLKMIIHTPNNPAALSITRCVRNQRTSTDNSSCSLHTAFAGFFAACTVVASAAGASSIEGAETLSNIPQTLSGECASSAKECKKPRIQRPKSTKAESCTVKCVNTCIRGGEGSPGEGPLNIRRPLVVFKQGFRSRQYCLVECSDICNLIGDGDDGP